jgi:hypothetical protein
LSIVGVMIAASMEKWISIFKSGFETIGDMAGSTGNAIMNALTGNLSTVKKNMDDIKGAYGSFLKDIDRITQHTAVARASAVDKILGRGEFAPIDPAKKIIPNNGGKNVSDTGIVQGPREGVSGRDFADPSIQATNPFDVNRPFLGPGGAPASSVEIGESDEQSQTQAATRIIASSLASIGGGGGSAAFTSDPALSEAKKQTNILETIASNTTPAGGGTTQPELT